MDIRLIKGFCFVLNPALFPKKILYRNIAAAKILTFRNPPNPRKVTLIDNLMQFNLIISHIHKNKVEISSPGQYSHTSIITNMFQGFPTKHPQYGSVTGAWIGHSGMFC